MTTSQLHRFKKRKVVHWQRRVTILKQMHKTNIFMDAPFPVFFAALSAIVVLAKANAEAASLAGGAVR